MLIEVSTFRVRDEAGFPALDAEYQQSVAYQRPGLLRRTTARGDNGEWLVVSLWEDDNDGAPLVPDEAESVETRRYTTLD